MIIHSTLQTAVRIALLGATVASFAEAASNLVPNPNFEGTGGLKLGTTGTVPEKWRAFAVGGGAASTSIIPVAAHELFTGSAETNAVRLNVTTFGSDQGFDDDNAKFPLTPGETYHLEFYVKTGNANGSSQSFRVGFPLFTSGGVYLGREPGRKDGLVATATWKRVVCPAFSDPEAALAHVAFRVNNDGGENSILIAWPVVGDPLERFTPPTAETIAQRPTWLAAERIVGATYFYWYRWPDLHFFDDGQHTDDALVDHFVDPQSVSMTSKDWHKKELSDMIDAGIDTLWPVYWAAPGNFDHAVYSLYVTGLVPLQQAIDELVAEGRRPLRIGMFYDTSSLLNSVRGVSPIDGKADLTTPEGKEIFYQTIRSFFATVHPRHWACIEGRPVTVLYASGFAAAYDQSSIDYVYSRFAADFAGVRPYIIRERSWNLQTESSYRWGAALAGPYVDGIAAVGPGFDDSAVPREPHFFRDRQGGDFYRNGWNTVLSSGRNIVHVETWNEMHEGTDVCESVEYARQYITLTADYAGRFKALRVMSMTPAPNSTLTSLPGAITLSFNQPLDPAAVNNETLILTRAGEDGIWGTADDAAVTPVSIAASQAQIAIDLAGVMLPEQAYRLTAGTGLRGRSGQPLYGTFAGNFPTGGDQTPGPFEVTFAISHVFAKADLDLDDDVDQSDFGILQACLTGSLVPQTDPACQTARLDADPDVDPDDLRIFLECLTGPSIPPDLTCGQ